MAAVPTLHINVKFGAQKVATGGTLTCQLHITDSFTLCRAFLAWRHGDSRYKPGGKVIGAVPVS